MSLFVAQVAVIINHASSTISLKCTVTTPLFILKKHTQQGAWLLHISIIFYLNIFYMHACLMCNVTSNSMQVRIRFSVCKIFKFTNFYFKVHLDCLNGFIVLMALYQ